MNHDTFRFETHKHTHSGALGRWISESCQFFGQDQSGDFREREGVRMQVRVYVTV